jgi:hypothetical protein
MFMVIAGLAFSSDIVIHSDEEGMTYKVIVTDDSRLTLEHYLLDDDIIEINAMRQTIRQMLVSKSSFLYQSPSQDLFLNIFEKLIKNDRLKH